MRKSVLRREFRSEVTMRSGSHYATLKREGVMATQNSIHVSDELLEELRAKAAAEGKTVDQLADEALRKGLEDRAWQDLLAYGRERGQASGYTEEDVPNVVRENRRRHRQ
jgi:hypothetical protein